MPSRKRNKGKERKAKKAELVVERTERERVVARSMWHGFARGEDNNRRKVIHCNHGLDLIPDGNHPVTGFMNSLYVNGTVNDMGIFDNLKELFQAHREVWDNENYRQMAVNIFIAIGTNFMLSNEDPNFLLQKDSTRNIAFAIVFLENYDGSGDFDLLLCTRGVATKMRDLNGCNSTFSIRDEIKFFRKRTTCSCLKRMHLEARKTFPKLGTCSHCFEVKERSLLMVCSRCRVYQYCSRDCHIAGFSEHKRVCDGYVCAREQHAKKR